MKKEKILPLKESIISFSPTIDFFLSVLENQHDITFPWILENYIDLIIRKDELSPPVFEFLDYNKIWWTCPFVHVSRIERQAFQIYGDIQTTIKMLLEKEFYMFFLVDTFYVEGYVTYKEEHVFHDMLVYGYENEDVYASDYFNFRNKKKMKIPFSSLIEGYQNVPKSYDYGRGVVLFKNEEISDNIALYQYKESLSGILDVEKVGYSMDRNLVKTKLARFLESPNYINSITPTIFDYRLGYTIGFKSLEILKDTISNQGDVTPKDIHLICCHAKLMQERVKYLMKSELNEKLKILDEKFKDILEKLDIIKKLIIKDMLKKTRSTETITLRYEIFLYLYRETLQEFQDYL